MSIGTPYRLTGQVCPVGEFLWATVQRIHRPIGLMSPNDMSSEVVVPSRNLNPGHGVTRSVNVALQNKRDGH
jgi:hypothetical protein